MKIVKKTSIRKWFMASVKFGLIIGGVIVVLAAYYIHHGVTMPPHLAGVINVKVNNDNMSLLFVMVQYDCKQGL